MRLIIFDLDGTLLDALPDLARTVNVTMAEYGCPPVADDVVALWIGRGSRVLFASALRHHGLDPDADGFDFEAAYNRFLAHYGENLTGGSRLYPGVTGMLETLKSRGLTLCVCTNKPERFVAPLLDEFGITQYFSAWLGGDSLERRKPHPEPLLHLARRFGCPMGECLMVGDSRHDVEAARAAGMAVVGMSYGYGSQQDFKAEPPDAVFDSMSELVPWLEACKAPLN